MNGMCCFLYWYVVGYATKPVHCLTLSRGGRAESDGRANKTLFACQYEKSRKRYTYDR